MYPTWLIFQPGGRERWSRLGLEIEEIVKLFLLELTILVLCMNGMNVTGIQILMLYYLQWVVKLH